MLNMYLEILETDEERATFTEIYNYNHLKMYYKALEILNDNAKAEDAVMNAFLKLAENYKKYKNETAKSMTSLCITITKNKAKDILRRESKLDFRALEDMEEYEVELAITQETVEEKVLNSETREETKERFKRAISVFPIETQRALILKYYNGYSVGQIAKTLGVSSKNVSAKIIRAEKQMRKLLRAKE